MINLLYPACGVVCAIAIAVGALTVAYRQHRRMKDAQLKEGAKRLGWWMEIDIANQMEEASLEAKSYLEAGLPAKALESLRLSLAGYRWNPWAEPTKRKKES